MFVTNYCLIRCERSNAGFGYTPNGYPRTDDRTPALTIIEMGMVDSHRTNGAFWT